jgi:hypothetical protein
VTRVASHAGLEFLVVQFELTYCGVLQMSHIRTERAHVRERGYPADFIPTRCCAAPLHAITLLSEPKIGSLHGAREVQEASTPTPQTAPLRALSARDRATFTMTPFHMFLALGMLITGSINTIVS